MRRSPTSTIEIRWNDPFRLVLAISIVALVVWVVTHSGAQGASTSRTSLGDVDNGDTASVLVSLDDSPFGMPIDSEESAPDTATSASRDAGTRTPGASRRAATGSSSTSTRPATTGGGTSLPPVGDDAETGPAPSTGGGQQGGAAPIDPAPGVDVGPITGGVPPVVTPGTPRPPSTPVQPALPALPAVELLLPVAPGELAIGAPGAPLSVRVTTPLAAPAEPLAVDLSLLGSSLAVEVPLAVAPLA